MKISSFLLFLSLTLAATNRSFGRSFDEIRKSGTALLATEGSLVPFNYFENNKLKGFEVDLADLLFKGLGIKTHWQPQGFHSLVIGVQQLRFDAAVASLAITTERMAAVRFVAPHYCSGPVLVALPGGPLSVKALNGKVAAAKIGTIYFKLLADTAGLKKAQSLPSNADLIQALLAKRVDAILVNEFAAANMLKANPDAKLETGEKLMEERLAIAVAQENPDLQRALNEKLALALKDGSYAQLSKKYFQRDLRCPDDQAIPGRVLTNR